MAEKIFRPPKSLKKKKKLVSKNYIVEQTTNGLRCDKLTEPVPHKQNRPTQPLLRPSNSGDSRKGISILYILNPFGECGLSMAKLLEKDNVVAEITYPFFETHGRTATISHPQYRCRYRNTEPYWLSITESYTLPPIMWRGGTGIVQCIG